MELDMAVDMAPAMVWMWNGYGCGYGSAVAVDMLWLWRYCSYRPVCYGCVILLLLDHHYPSPISGNEWYVCQLLTVYKGPREIEDTHPFEKPPLSTHLNSHPLTTCVATTMATPVAMAVETAMAVDLAPIMAAVMVPDMAVDTAVDMAPAMAVVTEPDMLGYGCGYGSRYGCGYGTGYGCGYGSGFGYCSYRPVCYRTCYSSCC
ncbi:hypothetical protein Cadr_000001068 [Camelus dromedarius]|uniref:Uncharacterized protein n=1 Tax=Camelus dromedarius TaxID=9838 RepID=A0A5N4EIK5_CAMDR|nr:hypothetical protein Cadr_000001068 [Camelus dromedarius]